MAKKNKKVDVYDFAGAMNDLLMDFSSATYSNMEKAVDETAAEVRPFLEENSPKRTGKYARSWRTQTEVRGKAVKMIIHNYQYQLPHLLEFGHAKVNGGRTRPQPHVEPAQSKADELFPKLLKRRIEADE